MKWFLIGLVSLNVFANVPPEIKILHKISYTVADYPSIPAHDLEEWKETKEFLEQAYQAFTQISLKQNLEIDTKFLEVIKLVKAKKPRKEVLDKLISLRQEFLRVVPVNLVQEMISVPQAQTLFQAQCASCHGNKADGKGIAGKGLKPRPTNFRSQKMQFLSPQNLALSIQHGIEGTSMAAFPNLSEKEVWGLAFYLMGLRYEGKKKPSPHSQAPSQAELAQLSDFELIQKYKIEKNKSAEWLASFR